MHNHEGEVLENGDMCNWADVTYEVAYNIENARMGCDVTTNSRIDETGCVNDLCSVRI
jgi:hypothetical protein